MADTNLTMLQALTYYNEKDKAWTTTQINNAISALGTVFNLKERKNALADLPSPSDPDETKRPSVGDVYTVGAADAEEFEEYYWNGSRWEYMGLTRANLDGYITDIQLYKGEGGTGTINAPADGTILKVVYTKIGEVDTALGELSALVGELPNDATATTVVGYVDEKAAAAAAPKADKLAAGSADQVLVDDGNGNLKGSGKTITAIKNDVIGTDENTKDNNTVIGAKKYADNVKTEVVGTASDAATADTIKGAKKYADGLVGDGSALDERIDAIEAAAGITEAQIDALFAD